MINLGEKYQAVSNFGEIINNKVRLKKLLNAPLVNGQQASSLMLPSGQHEPIDHKSSLSDNDFISASNHIQEIFPDLRGYISGQGLIFIMPVDRDINTAPTDIIACDVAVWAKGENLPSPAYRQHVVSEVLQRIKQYCDIAPMAFRVHNQTPSFVEAYLTTMVDPRFSMKTILSDPERFKEDQDIFHALCRQLLADFPDFIIEQLTDRLGIGGTTVTNYARGVSAPHPLLQVRCYELLAEGFSQLKNGVYFMQRRGDQKPVAKL